MSRYGGLLEPRLCNQFRILMFLPVHEIQRKYRLTILLSKISVFGPMEKPAKQHFLSFVVSQSDLNHER